MRYQGSEAYNYDYETAQERRRSQQQAQKASFEVVTGGGLDANARRGVSPKFVLRIKAVVAAALVVVVLGACRVALSVATVSTLQANSGLQTQIEEAQDINDELSIERSVLASNARISQIAQSYGMVLASDVETITVGDADAVDEAASDGEAAQTEDADAADEDL